MGKTIANVMKGPALLLVKTPDTHRAQWSTVQTQTGDHSVKLSKPGVEGGYCSTHVELTPLPAAAAKDMGDLMLADSAGNEWGWSHFRSAIAAYWEQMELRFEDPLTEGWVDVTIQRDVMATGGAEWEEVELAHATDQCMFGGWHPSCGSFSRWTLAALSALDTEMEAVMETAGTPTDTVQNQADWVLKRVRIELWETVWERSVYIDDIQLGGVMHTLEPGNATPGVRLSSNYAEVGYTEDGIIAEYTVEESDIDVDEETFPIDRVITKEGMAFSCNMAEATMANMALAMAGSVLSGATLKFGAGVNKKLGVQILATNPASKYRSITMPSCTATGAVSMTFQREGKVMVPVTFSALKPQGEPAVTIVENAA